jgi:DNA-binding beta-propeller fold protein YncE
MNKINLNKTVILLCILLYIVCSVDVIRCQNMEENNSMNERFLKSSEVRAPDFPSRLEWLNTDRKYSLKDFRGKIVLLDFWTYCCINCMHVIPDLKKLEEKYPELVVIGVHSAKYHNEKIKENIKQAILRYEIEHPVVIDNDFTLWRAYVINAWPSFILIDPQGNVVAKTAGEGIYQTIDPVVAELSKEFEKKGLLNKERLHFKLLKDTAPESVLYFPGKITAHSATKRLFITDSNHNRIIITNPEGKITDIIGSGKMGSADADFKNATFFRPQGLAFDPQRNCLYVADTENHLIRKIDFSSRQVATISGTGKQGNYTIRGGQGTAVALNSPWDLTILDDFLYIAMAGSHQIWSMNLQTYEANVYAGSGREDIIDGPRYEAALAQPSGITTDGKRLYFADSEVSAVRKIENDTVNTIIGVGLFDFGDIDGYYPDARLQHSIGILYHDGFLYVADTYNHKIKKVNPEEKKVSTYIGTGTRGYNDGNAKNAQLNEPNDITYLDGKFYIADTNNHLIRIYNPVSDKVSTLQFKNLASLTPMLNKKVEDFKAPQIKLPQKVISRHAKGINFKLKLPKGYKWTEGAPHFINFLSENEHVIHISPCESGEKCFDTFIPFEIIDTGSTVIKIRIVAYYCDIDKAAQCYFKSLELIQPITVAEKGKNDLTISYNLTPE